jgi:hypothetical protein
LADGWSAAAAASRRARDNRLRGEEVGMAAANGSHQWVGREERRTDRVTPTPCAALAATLDLDATPPAAGTPLPPLWH